MTPTRRNRDAVTSPNRATSLECGPDSHLRNRAGCKDDGKTMNTSTNSNDLELPSAFVTCVICAIDVPLDEAIVPEVADCLVYLCGLDCYAQWRGRAAMSFPALEG